MSSLTMGEQVAFNRILQSLGAPSVLMLVIGLLVTLVLVPATVHGAAHAEVDPTRPPSAVLSQTVITEDSVNIRVESIRKGSKQSSAVINGQRVVVGDVVSGARVVRIDRDKVTLAWPSQHRRRYEIQ